ncbi:MAG: undecaprenyl-diphosphate phosphatase [archaeon]
MNILQALILGIVQGITEWLPISSSGHLVIAQKLIGLEVPVSFDVLLHFATLLVIFLFFWRDIIKLAKSLFMLKTSTYEFKLSIYILVATIVTAIVVFPLKSIFESTFSNIWILGLGFLINGMLLLFSEKHLGSKKVSAKSSALIGIAQGLSFLPSISRSGSTIATALFLKIDKEEAFKFSFLIAIPAILGASLLEIPALATSGIALNALLAGFISSFIFGYLSLLVLKNMIAKNRFHYFAYYCIAIAITIFIIGFFF